MALFGFSDISFNKGTTNTRGPLAPLVQNEFQTTLLRYPLDVGNYDKGHYMVFYIREQRNTGFSAGTTGLMDKNFKFDDNQFAAKQTLTAAQNNTSGGASVGQQLLTKVNSALGQINSKTNGALSGLTGALGKVAGNVATSVDNLIQQANISIGGNSAATGAHIDTSIKSITGGSLGLLRTTRLTKDSIAMYMPDTLHYSYSQGYEDMPIGDELVGKILAAGNSAIDEGKQNGVWAGAAGVLKSAGLEAAKGVSGMAGDKTGEVLFQAMTGKVVNPMLEMVYKAPNFRQFQFDFTFYPRDEREALEVQRIIERFRFHQAPELVKGAGGFLVPPSEFDIKFYYSGTQNPNIPPIASGCVLTSIDVNYAPNGFSAYEVPGEDKPSLGRTGMPVAIQMQLQFKETTFLTKQDFNSGRIDSPKPPSAPTQSYGTPNYGNYDANGNYSG